MQQNQSDNGLVAIMALCAGISFLGNIFTYFFVKETGGKTLDEVDAACETLKKHDILVASNNSDLALRKLVVDASSGEPVTAVSGLAEA